MGELAALTIGELSAGYAQRRFAPEEVLEDVIDRIECVEPHIRALVSTRFDEAVAEARSLRRRSINSALPLAGVPFVVKDLLDVRGLPTRCGSRATYDTPPAPCDAASVAQLRRAGAILVGKSRTHEFGWGITTVADDGSATANPVDQARVAGGSSGGSAAAIAAGEVPLALGTDTAGSVRIPADFCGVVGLRPSPGLVPRGGAFPLAPSLDEVGPMTRTPADAEIVFEVLAPSRGNSPGPAADAPTRLDSLVIGVSPNLELEHADPTRHSILGRVLATLSEAGARIRDIDLSVARESYDIMGTIILAEGLAEHRRYGFWPARAGAYGGDVRARLELAEKVSLDDYLDASRRRNVLRNALAFTFAEVDLLVSLTSAVGPIRIDEPGSDPAFRRAVMSSTAIQSLCGLPACAVPAGVDHGGLPVGVQVTGKTGADREVLRVAGFIYRACAL